MPRRPTARRFFLEDLWQTLAGRAQRPTRPDRPGIECLEDRLVLSTYTVNSLADLNPPAGVMTLRQAILAADADGNTNPGQPDIINFSVSGTISLNAALPTITGAVSIQGPGESSLTVAGAANQSNNIFSLAKGASAEISGFTLAGDNDGGFSVGADATLSVEDAVIENCISQINGGAIDSEAGGGAVRVSNVQFLENYAYEFGGAIANIGGSLTITQCTFNEDVAGDFGGGIYDAASFQGGDGQLSVLDSTFSNDVASTHGGGVDVNTGGTAVIADSTFTGNESGFGGAISVHSDTNFTGTTVTLNLSESTISGNQAGGGLFIENGNANMPITVVVRDTIVASNTGGDVYGPVDPSSAFDLVGDGSGLSGIANGVNNNLVGTSAAPINPLLGPLQNNGGPTETMALLPGSPAIDRGGADPTIAALTTTDQRGDPRIVVQSFITESSTGNGQDIGAYELTSQTTPTVLTVDSLADTNPLSGVLTLRQAIEAADGIVALTSLPFGQVIQGSPYVFDIQIPVTGTIVLGSELPGIAADVIIQGPGASSLTIQGDNLGGSVFSLGAGASAIVSGVTLQGNGQSPNGLHNGGISVGIGAALSVQDAVIENCISQINGGAIDSEAGGGAVRVSNVQFLENYAYEFGGAIANIGGSLTVTQCTFNEDVAGDFGGGIYDAGGFQGGDGQLSVLDSTFSNDVASTHGGGVDVNTGGTAAIADSTFTGNESGFGGAISVHSDINFTGTTVTLNLSESTISGNQAGGGLFIENGNANMPITVVVRDTIVAGNTGGDVYGPMDPSSAFDLVGEGSGLSGIANGVNNNLVGTSATPINPLLGPLQNNGGPTETMALLPGSPALDAGSGEMTAGADQRGVLRGTVLDIGAYQATGSLLVVTTSAPAVIGVPQSVTVEALDAFGQPAYDDLDTISLASSDPLAVLSGPASLSAAVDSFFVTFGTAGNESLTASDSQNGLMGVQSDILVQKASASVNLSSSVDASLYGQSVTFTVTVLPVFADIGLPTGQVTLFDGANKLGTMTLTNGAASFTSAALSAGNHNLTVAYSGDSKFTAATSTALVQSVAKATTTNLLTVSPSPSSVGQSVTLTATLAAVVPAGGVPQGTVTFRDGSATIGSARLNAAGVATLQTSSLAVGTHSLNAVWYGDSNNIGSTSPVVVEAINSISNLTTTTLVSSNPNPSTYGEAITFTAVVSSMGGTPTGFVTFLNGTADIGTGMVINGQATFTYSSLAAGNHSITAIYGGDSYSASSTSTALNVMVNKANTTTTLAAFPAPASVGALITLTAEVASSAPGGGIPQGTVTFRDGSITIGTARLNASGIATLQVSTLSAGTHELSAIWFGDSNNVGSSSPLVSETIEQGELSQIVNDLLESGLTRNTTSGQSPS